MKNPLVCIIVLNWNGGNLTTECVSSLLKYTKYQNFKVLVVDNGSVDDSVDKIETRFKGITLIKLKKNFGVSKGMNVGAWYASRAYKPEYIIFLNNDVAVPKSQKNWLNGLIEDLENDPLAAVASPRIKLPNGKFEYEGWKLSGNGILSLLVLNLGALRRNRLTKKCYVNHGAGACILIKSAVLKQIGLFDERFSPFNYEDCDLFLRIKKAGYKVIYDPKYALNHGSSVSIKKYKKDKMLKYRTITGRNEIRFAYKHFPFYKIVPVLFVNLIRQFFDRDEGRLVMISYNPSSAIRLINEIDFGKEHVRISNKEAMNRIKKIYEI